MSTIECKKPGVLASILLAGLVLGGCQSADLPLPTVLTVQTADGWKIAIERFAPARSAAQADAMPVVLVHGLGYNGNFWHLTDRVSLARYLQRAGYDVFVPSLRGAGRSTKPLVSQLRQLFRLQFEQFDPRTALAGDPGLLRMNWTLDDHINGDVPAIIDAVLSASGKPRLHWVGHSMGGMILYGYLGLHPEACERIASFTALGSPMVLFKPHSEPLEAMAANKGALAFGNAAISTTLPGIVNAIGGELTAGPVERLFMNQANMTGDVVRLLPLRVQEDIAPGQLAQLVRLIERERFASADGTIDYASLLGKVTCPTLVVAGTLDNLCPLDSAQFAYHHIGSRERQWRLAGRVNGFSADYGHDDLVLGRNARAEVFPVIERWIRRFDKSAVTPATGASD
jgi:pimeloyl-ACP methyl ester carboxylesterase